MPQKEPVHFFVKLDEVRRALHNERECVAEVKQKLDNLLHKHSATLSWQYLDVETGIPHPATTPQIEGAMRALWPIESAPAIDPSHQLLAAIAGDREEVQRAAKKMQAREAERLADEAHLARIGFHFNEITTILGQSPETALAAARVSVATYRRLEAMAELRERQRDELQKELDSLRTDPGHVTEAEQNRPDFPDELKTALKAWRIVSASHGRDKPKARIKAWLDKHTDLSEKAKDRISVVCNWEKSGGPTRSD